MVVLFGLFHGLIYLPVLSSFIGPAPYKTGNNKVESDEIKKWEEIKFISGKLSYNYLSMTIAIQSLSKEDFGQKYRYLRMMLLCLKR